MTPSLLASILLAGLLPGTADGPALDYYEWIGIAPIVVAARSHGADGKFTELVIEEGLRGELVTGQEIRVDCRQANRERNPELDAKALHLDSGARYLLLLEPPRERAGAGTFDLVRGVRGARALPAEGAEAVLVAVRRFAEIYRRNDDAHTWSEFSRMLEDGEPLLLETALGQFVKFRRGSSLLLPSLRPLLFHPAEDIRRLSSRLIAQVLSSGTMAEAGEETTLLQGDLVSRARRDPAVEVRIAATEAVGSLAGTAVDVILREIAQEDPNQLVRYTAERMLYDRQRSAGEPAP